LIPKKLKNIRGQTEEIRRQKSEVRRIEDFRAARIRFLEIPSALKLIEIGEVYRN
jgi:hypothetical protein